MRRVGTSTVAFALCAVALLAVPALASARIAYFTGSEDGSGYAAPIELSTGVVGGSIPVSTEGPPSDVAITPNGKTAYVAGTFDELVRIDVATNTEDPAIPASGNPWTIAIAPDGTRAYTANRFENEVAVFDLATGTEVGTVPVGQEPAGIAVTPDGSRAYVTNQTDGTVSVIDLATEAVIDTIAVGSNPSGVAVTPDGSRIYVVNRLGESVSVIDVATGAVTATIPTPGVKGAEIAISPDGTRAYVLSLQEGVVPIDLATGTAGSTISLAEFNEDIAIAPDGGRAYITRQPPQSVSGELLPLDLVTNAFATGLEISEEPDALAIVPDQPPHASFTHSPEPVSPGSAVSFDATGSTDSDGTVARYDWDFGDGSSAANAGPTPQHTYAKDGSYQVTVTETDDEGCSTSIVFTGQTAYCNGSSVARATQTVTVAGAAAPATTTLVSPCPTVKPHAGSFKPRIRPGNIVPGVRVRLATATPSLLTVHPKLLWKRHGKLRRTRLRKLSVAVNRWRRVRFPIPGKLRDVLPLGSRVRVRLRIVATPRDRSTCGPATIVKILHVRVVKVFPHAVQAKRVR